MIDVYKRQVLDDVLKFFSGSLLPDWENQGRLFFSHYNSQGWRKGTGVQVTDWDSLANKWILDEKIKRDARSTGSKTNNPASGNSCLLYTSRVQHSMILLITLSIENR